MEAGGIALIVNAVSTTEVVGDFWKADAGYYFLVADITLETTTRETAPYNPFYFSLKDAKGFEYSPAIVAPKPQLQHGDLAQGEKVRGNVAFEIPTDSQGLILSYEPLVLLGGYKPLKVDLGH